MIETVESVGYGKKLGKYGFKPNLCTSKQQCEDWLDFCKKNDMVWLGKSYGTLVHKDFSNHFIEVRGHEADKLRGEYKPMDLNHSNVLKSKTNDSYIITSSPNYIVLEHIKKYPHSVYVIHPSLLEDYSLDGRINIAYCNWTFEQYAEINKAIYDDIGIFRAFRHLKY